MLILRYTRAEAITDPNVEPTMPSLTHKLILLISELKLITIRRVEALDDFPEVAELVRTWNTTITLDHLVNKFLDDMVTSYHNYLADDTQVLLLSVLYRVCAGRDGFMILFVWLI